MRRRRDQATEGERMVRMRPGSSGSRALWSLLQEAQKQFPQALGSVEIPSSPARFKRRYAATLVEIEAARAQSDARVEIAAFLSRRSASLFRLGTGSEDDPALDDAVAREAAPFTIQRGSGTPGSRSPADLSPARATLETLHRRHALNDAAARAAHHVLDAADTHEGRLFLHESRFAIMGAGAELAPASFLLQHGAEVLWLDVREPPAELLGSEAASRLRYVPGGVDLLRDPERARATIEAFADHEPVHVGMFAYAPGGGREWLLAATMNAIVRQLAPETLRSVGLYVSPTSPALLEEEDVAEAERRLSQGPAWQRVLDGLGVLGRSPRGDNGIRVACTVLPMQGASYQAAQYIEKRLTAEAFALHEGAWGGRPAPRVSANVAGITRTRSLRHPLFEAAFDGAAYFGVDVYAPETTRMVNALLWLHDVMFSQTSELRAGASSTEAEQAFQPKQFHGAAYCLPYDLNRAIWVAAALGLARRPGRVLDLARR